MESKPPLLVPMGVLGRSPRDVLILSVWFIRVCLGFLVPVLAVVPTQSGVPDLRTFPLSLLGYLAGSSGHKSWNHQALSHGTGGSATCVLQSWDPDVGIKISGIIPSHLSIGRSTLLYLSHEAVAISNKAGCHLETNDPLYSVPPRLS